MIKFIILLFFISLNSIAFSQEEKWVCNAEKSTCVKSVDNFTHENLIIKSVRTYVGEIKDNLPNGKGRITRTYFPNDKDKSKWDKVNKNNLQMESEGTVLTKSDNLTYLVNGFYITYDKIKYFVKDNELYKWESPNGDSYIGSFKYDGNDYGTRIYSNGEKFIGYFNKDGSFKNGTYTIPKNNGKFIGTFENNKYSNGTFFFNSGDKFIGTFKNYKFFEGTYYHSNGEKYVGSFDENSQKLNGTNYFANGSSVIVKNGSTLGKNYSSPELNAKTYPRPAEQKDPVLSWILGLGVLATFVVGIKTKSFLMGGGVLFGTTSLVFAFAPGPPIVLIMGIPATIALFYFGNKEIESRKKK
jgi:hypothetical protein